MKAHDPIRGRHRCAHCGHFIDWLRAPRDERRWFELLGVYVRNAFRPHALLLLALLAGCIFVTSFLPLFLGPILPAILVAGFLAFCLFLSTQGDHGLPRPDGDAGQAVTWGPAFRYAFSGLHGWLFVLPYVVHWFFVGDPFEMPFRPLPPGVISVVVIALSAALAPRVALVTAATGAQWSALSPTALRQAYDAAPQAYLRMALGLFCGIGLFSMALPYGIAWMTAWLPSELVAQWLSILLCLITPMILAFALGRFVHDNLRALGWSGDLDLPPIAHPDAVPTGTFSDAAAARLKRAGLDWQIEDARASAAPPLGPAVYVPPIQTSQQQPDEEFEDGIPLADMSSPLVSHPALSQPPAQDTADDAIPLAAPVAPPADARPAPRPAAPPAGETAPRPPRQPQRPQQPQRPDDDLFAPLGDDWKDG